MGKLLPNFNLCRANNLSKVNGNPKPKDTLIWKEFLLANYNFIDECSFRLSEEEVSDITMSLQNWVMKRNTDTYLKKNNDGDYIKTDVNIGDIFLTDLGLNFEKGYCRTALIVGNINDMVLVIPTTSQESYFEKAYHPIDNTKGDRLFRKVYKENGFDDNCVLLFDNLRIISKGRLLESNNTLKDKYDKENIYHDIMMQVFENLLPDYFMNHNNIIEQNKLMKKQIEELEAQILKIQEKQLTPKY